MIHKIILMIFVYSITLEIFTFGDTKLDLYNDQGVQSFSCNVELKEPFSCICLHSGLWKIYTSCYQFDYIAIKNKYCFSPKEMILRIEHSASNNSKLSITGRISREKFTSNTYKSQFSLNMDDLAFVRHPITIISEEKTSICIMGVHEEEQYCIFAVGKYLNSIRRTQEGCTKGSKEVKPLECHKVVKDMNECPSIDTDRDLNHKRMKRMLAPRAVSTVIPLADASDPDDADYWNEDTPDGKFYGPDVDVSKDNTKNLGSPIITSEVWNYLDQQLNEVLGLGSVTPSVEDILTYPIFSILDLNKQVMLKTCPSFYVNPEFFIVASDTFNAILLKRNYYHEFGSHYEGYTRIVNALSKCVKNEEPFPFIDESAHDICEGGHKEKTEVGAYEVYGNRSVLVAPQILESWNFEPIIDTVWKMFVNAYNYCFEYFDNTYNDIYRYATMIEALFQGEIHDLWTSQNTTGEMYGGFWGNLKEVTENVTLCVVGSGMESNVSWDLNRPPKDLLQRFKRQVFNSKDSLKTASCYYKTECHEPMVDFGFNNLS